jgi:hypothetical protein
MIASCAARSTVPDNPHPRSDPKSPQRPACLTDVLAAITLSSTAPKFVSIEIDASANNGSDLTIRRRLLLRVEWIVEDLNRFLRGWAAYFRYGNSADQFDKIN